MLSQSIASRHLGRTLSGYGVMIALAVGLFFLVRWQGATLIAPAPSAAAESGGARGSAATVSHPLLHLLLVLVAMIVVGRLLGRLLAYLAQPPVIGEVLAGICLGPSLLGRVWPEATTFPAAGGHCRHVVGRGADRRRVLHVPGGPGAQSRSSARAPDTSRWPSRTPASSCRSRWARCWRCGSTRCCPTSDVPFTAFALFLGVSMSITAFPVLARILTDRRLTATDLGAMALTCAAIDDVTRLVPAGARGGRGPDRRWNRRCWSCC